jgi:ABC-type polysaccharide/polyol phosphate export permease
VLDGTSPGTPVETPARDASSLLDAGTPPGAKTDEPRREIWFKRKVNIFSAVRELWSFRELAVTLAERDLRIRYKQAVLGIAWAVITPVMMMIAFTLIFSRVAHVKTGGVPYALFSYMGLLPWTFFSSALNAGGMSLVSNTPLLNKLYCPREVFPIAAIADAAVDAVIATFVLAALFPIEGFTPHAQIYYLPLLLLVMFMFTLGVTLAVSAIVVFMRDLRLVLPMVIQLGLFVSPVVYGSGAISGSHTFLVVYSILNPLVPVIDGIRGSVLHGAAPDWTALGAGGASSLVILIGGFMLFKKLETGMADIA